MADSALISRLRAAASVSALRAASGGCASTRACGRSPEGEALETQKRGRFRALSACRKRCAHPLAPSARGLRPQAVGERTVRLSEIFRAMARFSPSAPSGHLPRRGRFFDTLRGRFRALFFIYRYPYLFLPLTTNPPVHTSAMASAATTASQMPSTPMISGRVRMDTT